MQRALNAGVASPNFPIMPTLRLSAAGLVLDGLPVTLGKTTAAEISAALGEPARVSKPQNKKQHTIHTWDGAGLYAYCPPRKEYVGTLAIAMEPASYPFSPKAPFAGTIAWEERSFELPADAPAWPAFVVGEAKRQKVKPERGSPLAVLRLGSLAIHSSLDPTGARLTGVQFSPIEEAEVDAPPPIEVPEGEGVAFIDFNFKLLVLQELMYRQRVLTPKLDVHEFAKRHRAREIDVGKEGYAVIPEIRAFFERYPVPASLLHGIASLEQDGGHDIYLQICPFWEGEDDTFDVRSADDAALLPDLKKVRLFGAPSRELLAQFRARGIEVV